MSILIKGMGMPKEGEVVTVAISKGCADELIPDLFGMRYGCRFRVVEAPTPHGRLIDADKVIETHKVGNWDLHKVLAEAPTIIEAEV